MWTWISLMIASALSFLFVGISLASLTYLEYFSNSITECFPKSCKSSCSWLFQPLSKYSLSSYSIQDNLFKRKLIKHQLLHCLTYLSRLLFHKNYCNQSPFSRVSMWYSFIHLFNNLYSLSTLCSYLMTCIP